MKRDLKLTGLLTAISILLFATSTWAGSNCPQPRKTKSAPSNIASLERPPRQAQKMAKKSMLKEQNPWLAKCAMVTKVRAMANWAKL